MKITAAILTIVLLNFVSQSFSVYQDEIGVSNWFIQNIGKVNSVEFLKFEIFVATEKGIIALLDKQTGEILWRQSIPNNKIIDKIFVDSNEEYFVTITSDREQIFNWRKKDGGLLWQSTTPTSQRRHNTENTQALFLPNSEFVTLNNNHVSLFSNTTKLWNAFREVGEVLCISFVNQKLLSISQYNGVLGISNLDIIAGHKHTEMHQIPASTPISIHSIDKNYFSYIHLNTIVVVELTNFVITEIPFDKIPTNDVQSLKIASDRNSFYLIVESSNAYYSVSNENNQSMQDLKITELTKKINHDLCVLSKSSVDSKVLLSNVKMVNEQELDFSFFSNHHNKNDHLSNTRVLVNKQNHGSVDSLFCNQRIIGDCLVLMKDYTLFSIFPISSSSSSSSSLSVLWRRNESLAYIEKVHIYDIPILSSLEQMLRKNTTSILGHFIHRIEGEILYFTEKYTNFMNGIGELEKDYFGYNKLIIAISSTSKVFAIPSHSHSHIAWEIYLPNHNISDIYCLSSESEYCYLLTQNEHQKSSLYLINVLNGEYSNEELPFHVHHAMKTSNPTHPLLFIHSSIVSSSEIKASLYPLAVDPSNELLSSISSSYYYYQVNNEENLITGYSFELSSQKKSSGDQHFDLNEIWRIQLPNNERIASFASQTSLQINSPVRIVGLQTIEKYLNPNVIVIGTTYQNRNQRKELESPSIAIYLIDTISGSILYRTHIQDAIPPLHILICENWVTFTYQNMHSYQHEISVIDLFRDSVYWDDQTFSSFKHNDPTLVDIKHQTYELPTGITAIGVTTTRLGITPPAILFALKSNQLVYVDKRFVDSLRPVDRNGEVPEGLIPYYPVIRFGDRSFLTYSLNVIGMKGIESTSTNLESTSAVVAYGLDIFYSCVQPADAFDILNSEFDRFTLFAVVSALSICTYVTLQMSNTQDLKKKWA